MTIHTRSLLPFAMLPSILVPLIGFMAQAQTQPELALKTYAGLTIQGTVGSVYAVEFITDLILSNNASAWKCVEFLQLPATPYLWVDKSAPAISNRFYRATVFPTPTNMVFVAPGTFRMGSPTNELDRQASEGPQTAVILSRGFWIAKYEVTQEEYEAVVGSNPSQFAGDSSRPVDSVNFNDARNYCMRLGERERTAGRLPTYAAYRLPTEGEWEYACRGWTSTRFSFGDDEGYTDLANYAWLATNSAETTHPVGLKLPNPLGLFDVHGNVSEWCLDANGAYPGGIALDPVRLSGGFNRVVRGGDWHSDAKYCRSSVRGQISPGYAVNSIGFRVVLAPIPP